MAPSTEPVVLIAEFTARAGYASTVADLLAGLAENVRREEGNLVFDCYRRADDGAKFVVYEVYRDRAAFEAHIAADYGATFNARLQELIVEPHSILTFLDPLRA
jgi:quinol monooxygenase YgiN